MGGTRGSDTEEDICNGCEGKEEAMEADTQQEGRGVTKKKDRLCVSGTEFYLARGE
jgi:hypothetical protein